MKKSLSVMSKIAVLALVVVVLASVTIAIVYADKSEDKKNYMSELSDVVENETQDNKPAESETVADEIETTEEDYYLSYAKACVADCRLATLDPDTLEVTSKVELLNFGSDTLFGYLLDLTDASGRCAYIVIDAEKGFAEYAESQSAIYTTKFPVDSFKAFYFSYLELWGLDENGVYTELHSDQTITQEDIHVAE